MINFSIILESILCIAFFLIPVIAVICFVVSLISFCIARKRNKEVPGSYSDSQIKTRKIFLIISSVIAGILLAIVIGIIVLLYTAVAFM